MVELSPVTISVARTPRRSEFGLSVVLSATVPWDDATATFITSLEQVLRGLPVAPHSFLELTPEMRIHFVEGIYLADKHRIITPVRSLEIILMVPPALGCRLWDELPSVNDGPSLDAALAPSKDHVAALIRTWVGERAASGNLGAEETELAARLHQVAVRLGDAELSGLLQRRFAHLGEETSTILSGKH